MRRLILAGLLVLLSSPPAGAVTLMVNGDTPSVRYQRWVNAMLVPTPDVTVSFYLYKRGDQSICPVFLDAAGCSLSGGAPTLGLGLDFVAADRRDTLYHELGHILADLTMSPDLWNQFSLLVGLRGDLQENFADAVMICSLDRRARIARYWWPEDLRYNTGPGGLLLSRAQFSDTCRFLRGL